MTRLFRGAPATRCAALLLGTLMLGFAACESEPTKPVRSTNAAVSEPPEPAEPKPPRKPIRTETTDWPGIEARLMECSSRGTTLLVEIELANTSSAPVTIENYSARQAVMADDKSKHSYEVLEVGGPPVATDGLTQTLAPNESTTVTASFPLPRNAELVTVIFPKIGKFEAVPLGHRQQAGAGAQKNGNANDGHGGAADRKPAKKP